MQIPKTIIDLEALLIALEQQTEPLPEDIQRSLKKVGQFLVEKRPEAPQELRQLIKDYPPLEKAYKKAIKELDAAYANQERAKSLSAIFPDTLDFEALFIHDVIPSGNWVKTAQKLTRELAIPPSPLNKGGADSNIPATSSRFWDKADRLMVVTVGGAALGGAIAGVYGAIIGAVLAAGYGWYITFRKMRSIELDSDRTKILKTLEKSFLTLEDISYTLGKPLSITQDIVTDLWQKGYIDYLNSSTIYILFPGLRSRQHQKSTVKTDEFLTLTRRGYFSLYPLFRKLA